MVVPSIPQLHEGLLGPHIVGSDIDNGSFNANLVCGVNDKPGVVAATHPSIKFDEPIYDMRVIAKALPSGRVLWDAFYSLGGSKELTSKTEAVGGAVPHFSKICTPQGDIENYKIDVSANGQSSGNFDSSISFTSNNAHTLKLSEFLFPKRPTLPRPPDNPPIVPLDPTDLNPYKYM